jgi:hypothetical protein
VWFDTLWAEIPDQILLGLAVREPRLLREALSRCWSGARLEVILEHARVPLPEAFEHLKETQVDVALAFARRVSDRVGLTVLWRRFETEMVARLGALLKDGDALGVDFVLEAAPRGARKSIVTRLAAAISERGVAHPAFGPIRRHLARLCRTRGEGFHEAYALLHDVEQRLLRVGTARGRGPSERSRPVARGTTPRDR